MLCGWDVDSKLRKIICLCVFYRFDCSSIYLSQTAINLSGYKRHKSSHCVLLPSNFPSDRPCVPFINTGRYHWQTATGQISYSTALHRLRRRRQITYNHVGLLYSSWIMHICHKIALLNHLADSRYQATREYLIIQKLDARKSLTVAHPAISLAAC